MINTIKILNLVFVHKGTFKGVSSKCYINAGV